MQPDDLRDFAGERLGEPKAFMVHVRFYGGCDPRESRHYGQTSSPRSTPSQIENAGAVRQGGPPPDREIGQTGTQADQGRVQLQGKGFRIVREKRATISVSVSPGYGLNAAGVPPDVAVQPIKVIAAGFGGGEVSFLQEN